MDEDYYDQDDGPRSPGLEKSKIYYAPKESPPPFLVDKGSDSEAPKKFADEGTSQDCSHPNRPDIAAYERSHPLSEDLRHEDDFLLNKTQLRRPDPPLPTDESPKPPSDLNEAAKSALSLLLGKEAPKPEEATPLPLVLPPVGAADSPPKKELFKTLLNDDHDSIKREPDTPPISQPSSNPYAPEANAPEAKRVKSESPLSRFIIPTSEASTQNLLPALDSPDNSHTLPSLQTALGLQNVPPKDPARPNGSSPFSLPPVTATSPPGLRTETAWEHQRAGPFGAQIPPSPYSHWSPASTTARDLSAVSSPASQNSHWRSLKSDISYLKSPYEVPPPAAKSPATSYPTPTDQTPASTCDRTPYNAPTPSNGAAVSTGAFKCGWPGCNAPPFQTQYLLNSHANVHSQDRPHFCSIEGCPRGPGGKGFKRKNEMIRHGLVHNSPGYVCPFCPDQQHKYPRPDNLQRHVRVHHVDKSKDDPALRQVLSQRPEGSVRGRRRRQSVQ